MRRFAFNFNFAFMDEELKVEAQSRMTNPWKCTDERSLGFPADTTVLIALVATTTAWLLFRATTHAALLRRAVGFGLSREFRYVDRGKF